MAPDAAPALFYELTAAGAKGTKWYLYFSVEHCARPKGADGPKGVWLQCLACSELLSPSNPWRLVGPLGHVQSCDKKPGCCAEHRGRLLFHGRQQLGGGPALVVRFGLTQHVHAPASSQHAECTRNPSWL
jgi:hypothetical protein